MLSFLLLIEPARLPPIYYYLLLSPLSGAISSVLFLILRTALARRAHPVPICLPLSRLLIRASRLAVPPVDPSTLVHSHHAAKRTRLRRPVFPLPRAAFLETRTSKHGIHHSNRTLHFTIQQDSQPADPRSRLSRSLCRFPRVQPAVLFVQALISAFNNCNIAVPILVNPRPSRRLSLSH